MSATAGRHRPSPETPQFADPDGVYVVRDARPWLRSWTVIANWPGGSDRVTCRDENFALRLQDEAQDILRTQGSVDMEVVYGHALAGWLKV